MAESPDEETRALEQRCVVKPLEDFTSRADIASAPPPELDEYGCLLVRASDLDGASEVFRRSLDLSPDYLEPALNLGFIHTVLVGGPKNFHGLPSLLTSALERHPDEPRLYIHLAELYETSSMNEAAASMLLTAMEKCPDCLELYDLAARYRIMGDPAAEEFEKRVAENIRAARSAENPLRLGAALVAAARYSGKDFQSAVEPLGAALASEPESAQVRLLLSGVAEETGDEEKAREHHEAAVELKGGAAARFEYASFLLRKSEFQRSIEEFAEACDSAPHNAAYAYALMYALFTLKRLRRQEIQAEAGAKAHPEDEEAVVALADSRLDSGSPLEALRILDELLAKHPASARAHASRGRAFMKLNRNDEAERSLKRAIECDPSFPEAHRHLAALYMKTGRTIEALTELDLASAEPTPQED